jgi:hypothetical protein
MSSCPCTMLSSIQNLNWKKLPREERERAFREALLHLQFSMLVCDFQQANGRKYIHEHPDNCMSWDTDVVKNRARDKYASMPRFHMCAYGLKSKVQELPVLKTTKLLTNLREVHEKINGVWCPGPEHHPKHQILQGLEGGMKRSEWAQRYPDKFCQAVIEAVQVFLTQGGNDEEP